VLQALIGPIAGLAQTWMANRQEQSQAKHVAKMQVIQNTATWEQHMAQASANSWKDEWFTVVLSAPVLAIMWGVGMNDLDIIARVGMAFEELSRLPDWYSYLLYVAVTASFGIRGADKLMQMKGGK
tara:strand:+ start:422 stop:799 length:378 start_codon:yes stop_codon:yes gene_type:complete